MILHIPFITLYCHLQTYIFLMSLLILKLRCFFKKHLERDLSHNMKLCRDRAVSLFCQKDTKQLPILYLHLVSPKHTTLEITYDMQGNYQSEPFQKMLKLHYTCTLCDASFSSSSLSLAITASWCSRAAVTFFLILLRKD